MYLELPDKLPQTTGLLTHRSIARSGEMSDLSQAVLTEHALTVTVNGTLTQSFVCLPEHLPELLIGHLATERLIQSAEEIEEILFDPSGEHARITLTHPLAQTLPKPAPIAPVFWKTEWIFALADRFAAGMPIHQQTFATHSCFLAVKDQILFECEDIGRHNALDKAVGHALIKNLPLRDCILYSSGRMPTDMLRKALHAGVPVLASKGAPTAKAVELARSFNLTLICAARKDRMKLFSGSLPMP